MSQVKIYLYGNCSSCKDAESVLKSSGVVYERRDIFRDQLTVGELKDLFSEIKLRPSEVLSRRSIPYRELALASREISEDELIDLMSNYPGLLRRPIIVAPGTVQIGFKRSALESLAQNYGQG
jgi:regulatory protein spx